MILVTSVLVLDHSSCRSPNSPNAKIRFCILTAPFFLGIGKGNTQSNARPLFVHCPQGLLRSHFSLECRQLVQLETTPLADLI